MNLETIEKLRQIARVPLWTAWVGSILLWILREQLMLPTNLRAILPYLGLFSGILLITYMALAKTYGSAWGLFAVIVPFWLIFWQAIVPEAPGYFTVPGLIIVLAVIALLTARRFRIRRERQEGDRNYPDNNEQQEHI
jgi:hypothetical protein